ncbi:alpha-1,2-mannosyltransferase ALG9-like [Halichondria panicea]|uniref:alpha-1,2-mannosyltransferase ALG9-like n=1 Tax=Halichondria panicea TaxID=6063 RepID=UPI00312B7DD6
MGEGREEVSEQPKRRLFSLRGWQPTLGGAFRSILVARMISAFCMHISDCDETFNYWEPFHYIGFHKGLQTWEYSPTYALRSYGYLLLHFIPMQLVRSGNKMLAFYMLRVVFAFMCTVCEFYFYRAVLTRFGAQVANWTLLFLCASCGMYIASTAFLPSSFAMYLTMIAMGAWFLQNYELAIFAVAFSTLVGWPFSAAVGLPIAVDLVIKQRKIVFFTAWSFFCFIVISVPLIAVDSYYYGKFVFAPWNILKYNVFGNAGPALYGVEPWSFYFINGFLNFNVVFILALLAIPLIEFRVLFDTLACTLGGERVLHNTLQVYSGLRDSSTTAVSKSYRHVIGSMLVWILVFFTRSHKEERFLFPIYPLFGLSAAVTLTLLPETTPIILGLLRCPRPLRRLARSCVNWVPSVVAVVYALLSLSRVYALYSGYSAPIEVYKSLYYEDIQNIVQPIYTDVNVCVGKEWYRFPSSFFLPGHRWNLRFLRSGFKGQLPQPYTEGANGTCIIPNDMNDINKEEPSRYFDISECHFLVDLDLPESSDEDPSYFKDTKTWKLVASHPFLDAQRSHKFYRAFYIPFLSKKYTKYVDYVVLLNKVLFEKIKKKLTPNYHKSAAY